MTTLWVLTTCAVASGALVVASQEQADTRVASQEQLAEAATDSVLVVAAGDIACPDNNAAFNGGEGTATKCRQKHTSNMILDADHVFVLGDGQYSIGSLQQYRSVYDATWGRKKAVSHPAPGDHDYQSGSPAGYFAYWGVDPYYSFDVGAWHWVSLNSEIDHSATSAQVRWLQQDLAETTQPCIGAFWGSPRFSSGEHGSNPAFNPFWDALSDVGADLVLAGDDHDYERFAKQTSEGTASSDGVRQFVVGTGGRNLSDFTTIQPHSEARAKVFGVLELQLNSNSYDWEFRTESGGVFADSGSATCNALPGEPPPTDSASPTPTETLTASPTETVSASPTISVSPTETVIPTETITPTETVTPIPTATPTSSAWCYNVPATIVGTKNADTLIGTPGADVIAGLGGDDRIDGGGGDDVICGANGADTIDGGSGDDLISGGVSDDELTDLSGDDVLDGRRGSDTIDVADGLAADTAVGGADTDTCRVDMGDNTPRCESAGGR